MSHKIPPATTLVGDHVLLEPLTAAHLPDLFEAGGGDEEVWRWLPVAPPATLADLEAVYAGVAIEQEKGELSAFAVVARASGRAVGWTTFLDVPGFTDSIEIGWTWYGRSVWRTAVNTETKLLLLGHAFDDHGFNRVMLKTDCLNHRSQAAIARLGAKHEGTLRRHRRRADGTWRDSVYFGIIDEEWPDVRRNLVERLARG